MATYLRCAVFLFAVLVFPACHKEGSGSTSSAACEGEYDTLLDAYCDVLERCPTAYPADFRDRAECRSFLCFATTCRLDSIRIGTTRQFTLKQLVPGMAQPGQVQACADFIKSASCESLNQGLPIGSGDTSSSSSGAPTANPCSGIMLIPTDDDSGAKAGEDCNDRRCASGLICAPSSVDVDAGVEHCAVCVALPKDGQPCVSGQCASGFYCDYTAQGETRCTAMVADGGACTQDTACASGFCNPSSKHCDAGGKVGGTCANDADCRPGNFCNASAQCEKKHPNGGACTSDPQCQQQNCDEPSGHCGKPDGSSCFNDYECAGACDPTSKKCTAALANGAPCTEDGQCASRYCTYNGARVCAERCIESGCSAGQYCDFQNDKCQPLKTDGASCDASDECVSGRCWQDKCGEPPALGAACSGYGSCSPIGYCNAGVCTAFKKAGEACDSLDSCAAPSVCVAGTCSPMNLSCAPAAAGERCAFLQVCDDASYCDLADGITCKPRKAAGEACGSENECQKQLFCDTAAGQCVPRLGAGSACTSETQCTDGTHCARAGQTAATTCVPAPTGQPCDPSEGIKCPDGYFCDSRQCRAYLKEGESCRQTSDCTAGLYCESTCKKPGTLGATCASYMPCAEPFYCDSSSKCQADVAEGGACQDSSFGPECAAGLYCRWDSASSKSSCAPRKSTGAACSNDKECVSGRCYSAYGCLASAECSLP